MRHGKKINHLGRTDTHRKAMLANMASSLILHKRINTTLAKAKALRKYVEPLITKAKSDTTHSRRVVFGYLQDKTSVAELFREVAVKIADRPGGYTRIIKTGNRLGDNAETCFIELVDYNEIYTQSDKEAEKKSTRRSRRGKKSAGKGAEGAESPAVAETTVEETKAAAENEASAPAAEKAKAESPESSGPKPESQAEAADKGAESPAEDAEVAEETAASPAGETESRQPEAKTESAPAGGQEAEDKKEGQKPAGDEDKKEDKKDKE